MGNSSDMTATDAYANTVEMQQRQIEQLQQRVKELQHQLCEVASYENAVVIKERDALRAILDHIKENGGCMCEREEGESQKDCDICYPR